jgi:hypothetical protein
MRTTLADSLATCARGPWSALALCALGAAAPAQSETAPAAAASGPRVVLETALGELKTLELAGFQTSDPRELGARRVRFEGLPPVAPRAGGRAQAVVTLANGDQLFGRVKGGLGELLDIELAGGVHVAISIDALASLVIPDHVPQAWSTPLEAPAEGDRIYRRQGDKLDPDQGGTEEFTSEGVRFHGQVGTKLTPWSDLAGLFIESLGPDEQPAPPAGTVPVVVDLVDHSRMHGGLERLGAEGCRLRVLGDQTLELPAAVVAGVLVDDGALAFLSTLPPSQALHSSPFGDDLGLRWPHRIDRSVSGAPLVAAGRTYVRGIGVHAPSRMSWTLAEGWKELRGSCAVDDQTLRLPARGSVRFRVLLDGERAWESPVLRGGDPPVAFRVPLAAHRELVLEVDVADQSYVGDRADWLDVLLAR